MVYLTMLFDESLDLQEEKWQRLTIEQVGNSFDKIQNE